MTFIRTSAPLIGNLLTNYETALFGWIAPILAPLLFPHETALNALLCTYALLPLCYLAKPLGALFWGFLGDKIGRRPVLMYTLFGSAIATVGMALLPLGPWMMGGFLLCKSLQKFCYGGEKKGAALYLLEHNKTNHGLWGSVYDGFGITGIFLASLAVQLLGREHWRLLFLIGAFVALFGIWLRLRGKETPDFSPAQFSKRALLNNKGPLLRIFLASGFSYLNYNLITVFMNGYLPQISKVSIDEALWMNTHLLWLDVGLLIFFGILSLKINPERLMQISSGLIALLAIPLFGMLQDASFYQVLFIRTFFITLGVAFAAPYHAWALRTSPKEYRFTFCSLGSALGGAFFGSTAPWLATYLSSWAGGPWIAGVPLLISGILAAFAIQERGIFSIVKAPNREYAT